MASNRRISFSLAAILAGMLISGIAVGAIGHKLLSSLVSSNVGPSPGEDSNVVTISNTESENSGITGNLDTLPAEDSISDLSGIAEIKGEFARNSALHTLLLSLDKNELSALIQQTQEFRPGALQAKLLRPIVLRLTMIDPVLALESIEDLPFRPRDSLTRTILGEWAQLSLDQAVAYAKGLTDVQQYAALRGILESRVDLSEQVRRKIAIDVGNESVADEVIRNESYINMLQNPQQSWVEAVANLDESLESLQDLLNVATEWVRQSGLGVLNQISDSLDDSSRRTSVLSAAVTHAARSNPSGTVKQLLEMNEQVARSTVPTAIRIWAKSNPQSALLAASDVESSSLRSSLQKSVISEWARGDAGELLASIDSIPENLVHLAQERALKALSSSDPVEAARLFEVLNLNDKETGIAYNIVSNWSKSDPFSALDWVFNTPALEDIQGELLKSVIGNLAKSDPDRAMDLALQQPIELGLDAIVISRLASIDPLKALDLLSQIRVSDHVHSAYTSVGSALVRIGQRDRAIKLASELPSFDRHIYYQSVFRQWARTDPEELIASIDKLPSSDVKSNAALALAMQSRLDNSTLTQEQLEYAKTFLNERDTNALDSRSTFVRFGGPGSIVGDDFLGPGELDEILDELNQSLPDMQIRGPVVRKTIIVE